MFEVNPAWSENDPGPEISNLSDEELFALMETDARRIGAPCKEESDAILAMEGCDPLIWMGIVPAHLYPNPC